MEQGHENGKTLMNSFSPRQTQITTTRKYASIVIKQAESFDGGVYTVKLSNNVSEVTADFVVSIKGT